MNGVDVFMMSVGIICLVCFIVYLEKIVARMKNKEQLLADKSNYFSKEQLDKGVALVEAQKSFEETMNGWTGLCLAVMFLGIFIILVTFLILGKGIGNLSINAKAMMCLLSLLGGLGVFVCLSISFTVDIYYQMRIKMAGGKRMFRDEVEYAKSTMRKPRHKRTMRGD